MKFLITGILIVALTIALTQYRKHRAIEFGNKQLEKVETENKEKIKSINQELKKQLEKEKIKVFIKGKDAKTCMRELKTNELNNEVVTCNNDHYIEIERDQAEKFKE